jgi:hypothetical protein
MNRLSRRAIWRIQAARTTVMSVFRLLSRDTIRSSCS